MKILIFSWRDIKHPGWGGAEVLTMELAKRWVKKGHQVSLVSAKFPNAKDQETIDGVKIFRPAMFYGQSPFEYLTYLYQTAKFYQKNLAGQYDLGIDQVHGLPLFTPFYVREKVILFPLEVAKKVWFYEVRFPFSLAGYLLELAYIKLFKNLPFLTISASTAKDLTNLGVKNVFTVTPGLNFPPARKLPWKNDVLPERGGSGFPALGSGRLFASASSPTTERRGIRGFENKFPQLISLGRITEMKRVGDTIQAFRLLHKEFPFIKLVVVGRGKPKYLEKLKNLCQKMAIEDRVSFTGFVSEEEKRELLSQAWVLVSTSIKEGWGLTVIEAAACGTPTVAYQIPGLVDSVKNQETGLLCQKNTPVELARNIRKLLLNPPLRKQLSQNALDYSRNFSWDMAAKEGLAVFEKIISQGRLQPLSAKLGEVRFRQKLVKQHLGEGKFVPDEPDKKEVLAILKQRVNSTRKIFNNLKAKGFALSPFLEIGAEKGQRSMVLINELGGEGFASDLSLESLVSAPKFAKLLGFKKLPTLVTCDAYALPFADQSLPFIFCFETLHHFPDPTPIVKEIYRVLSPGGIFYFGEEPVKQLINLPLWRRGYHLSPFEKFLKAIGILPFLSRIGKTEVSHGILEEEFSLRTWKKALSLFERLETEVRPVFFGPRSFLVKDQNGWQNPKLITQILTALQGGGIGGLAIKKGKLKFQQEIEKTLICPDCKKKITQKGKGFYCFQCQRFFAQKNGVWLVLPAKLQEKLYG